MNTETFKKATELSNTIIERQEIVDTYNAYLSIIEKPDGKIFDINEKHVRKILEELPKEYIIKGLRELLYVAENKLKISQTEFDQL